MAGFVLPKLKEGAKYGLYTAGPEGFTEEGRIYHRTVVLPKLATLDHVEVHSPWAQLLRLSEEEIMASIGTLDHRQLMEIGRNNRDLIAKSQIILANLNGTDTDGGTSAELGIGLGDHLMVGYRTDIRYSGESGLVTLQVEETIEEAGGKIFRSLQESIEFIRAKISEALGT